MEYKIGEIFEEDGKWYQCLVGHGCNDCYKCDKLCTTNERSDKTSVTFKELEKIGEPYEYVVHNRGIVMLQPYKLFTTPIINGVVCNVHYDSYTIDLEIKSNKEDMEEKKLDPHMEKVIDEATQKMGKEIHRQIEVNLNKQKIKPFSLEQAKAGKPVCTKNGKKARIICFDAKGILPIIALVESGNEEKTVRYSNGGRFRFDGMPDEEDLMMLPKKKEGWILLSKKDAAIFTDKELAEKSCTDSYFVAKVSWEE